MIHQYLHCDTDGNHIDCH